MRANAGGLAAFLRARRDLVSPEDAGFDRIGPRRVPGLRREELAILAGISVNYYVRLERGIDRQPSELVVDALARALGLDDAATAHLHHLARPPAASRGRRGRSQPVQPTVLELLDAWTERPAFVLGPHLEVLAANRFAALLNPGFAVGTNLLRFIFLDARATDVYVRWESVAGDAVATLRASVGSDLDDPSLVALVGELSLKSEAFRRLWARHEVRGKTTGTKRYRHPQVGELTVGFETLAISASPGQVLVVYGVEAGSADERTLRLLASLLPVTAAPVPQGVSATDAAASPGHLRTDGERRRRSAPEREGPSWQAAVGARESPSPDAAPALRGAGRGRRAP